MTDREQAMLQVMNGLLANSWYVNRAYFNGGGLAKNVVEDAKDIVDKFFKN